MINKYRNWADQYLDYIVEQPSDADENSTKPKRKSKERKTRVRSAPIAGDASQAIKSGSHNDEIGKGKKKESDSPEMRRGKSEKPQYINFSKVTLLGQQILEFTEYQTNLSVLELRDPEMKNKVDSTLRTFLKHLPGYDDETLWKLSLTCEPLDTE